MSDKEELTELMRKRWIPAGSWEDIAQVVIDSDWLRRVRAEAAAQVEMHAFPTVDELADSLRIHRRKASHGTEKAFYRAMAEDVLAVLQSYRGFTPMEGTKQ